MAYVAKTAKPRMFSTYVEVIRLVNQIRTEVMNIGTSSVTVDIMKQGQIEGFIIDATAEVENSLKRFYTTANLRVTPWVTVPFPNMNNNSSSGSLLSVSIETTTAYTAAWTIEFTADTPSNYLLYDTQTGNFAADLTVTGTISGATGVIMTDTNWGTEGVLKLKTVSGVFQDDEEITDTDTGVATVNGTLGDMYLAYDGQTGDFTVGSELLGTTSGAIATIVGDQDDGVDGKLVLTRTSDDFINNEPITDADTGAAVANGASTYVEEDTQVTYSLKSSLEGIQSAVGAIGTDITSTNGDVLIPSIAWDGTFVDGDYFYFSVIDANPMIASLTTKLAAAMVLESIYQQEEPNMVTYSQKLRRQVEGHLDRLNKPYADNGLQLSTFAAPSGASIWVDYDINDVGQDQSSYLTNENSYN